MKTNVKIITIDDSAIKEMDFITAANIKELLDTPLKGFGLLIKKARFCKVKVKPEYMATYAPEGNFFQNKNKVWTLYFLDDSVIGFYCTFTGKIYIVPTGVMKVRWAFMADAIYKWEEYENEDGEEFVQMRNFVCYPTCMIYRYDREVDKDEIK